ncbi:hypothetical protein [Mesorhizobium sp. SP-1A]|uniref:hypothetical protein n=1 Tax=Mesorhizobium sp. SP-1A TaxID=3077840 RepID=UPI0028F740D3|nr:hypothetical protein [Mesorhizobium sp. SP-1A]
MTEQNAQTWLAQTRELAEQGDPTALMNLGLAHWHGRVVPRDVDKSISLIQASEEKLGEPAWVERLRILCFENDPRIEKAFEERMPHKNGMACFMYGQYLKSINPAKAIEVYKLGADSGHYGCETQYHLQTHKGFRSILGLPKLLWIFARALRAGTRDPDDVNVKV